jgi:hypothetical protein
VRRRGLAMAGRESLARGRRATRRAADGRAAGGCRMRCLGAAFLVLARNRGVAPPATCGWTVRTFRSVAEMFGSSTAMSRLVVRVGIRHRRGEIGSMRVCPAGLPCGCNPCDGNPVRGGQSAEADQSAEANQTQCKHRDYAARACRARPTKQQAAQIDPGRLHVHRSSAALPGSATPPRLDRQMDMGWIDNRRGFPRQPRLRARRVPLWRAVGRAGRKVNFLLAFVVYGWEVEVWMPLRLDHDIPGSLCLESSRRCLDGKLLCAGRAEREPATVLDQPSCVGGLRFVDNPALPTAADDRAGACLCAKCGRWAFLRGVVALPQHDQQRESRGACPLQAGMACLVCRQRPAEGHQNVRRGICPTTSDSRWSGPCGSRTAVALAWHRAGSELLGPRRFHPHARFGEPSDWWGRSSELFAAANVPTESSAGTGKAAELPIAGRRTSELLES